MDKRLIEAVKHPTDEDMRRYVPRALTLLLIMETIRIEQANSPGPHVESVKRMTEHYRDRYLLEPEPEELAATMAFVKRFGIETEKGVQPLGSIELKGGSMAMEVTLNESIQNPIAYTLALTIVLQGLDTEEPVLLEATTVEEAKVMHEAAEIAERLRINSTEAVPLH